MGHSAAVQLIHAEHRTIAAVMHGLLDFTARVRCGRPLPDIKPVRAMLYYLDVFPDQFHHPKEDRYLFARLRRRTREADEVLDRLEEEHAHGSQQIRELAQASIRLEFGAPRYLETFVSKVDAYAVVQLRHMGLEEDIVLPCAERELTASDWEAINAAFNGRVDPLLGVDVKKGFDELYARVVNLASLDAAPAHN